MFWNDKVGLLLDWSALSRESLWNFIIKRVKMLGYIKKKSYSSLFFSSAGLCASHFTKHFFLVVQCIITSNCKLFTCCRQMIKHWLQHASYWVFRSHRCACGFAIVKLRRLAKHLQNHFQKARYVPFAYLQEIIRMKIFCISLSVIVYCFDCIFY